MIKVTNIFKIIFINFFIFYLILYFVELSINFSSGKIFEKTRFEHLKDLSKKYDEEFYYNFFPYKLLNKKNLKILPISGYPNSWTLLCLDDNKPIYYRSDSNGFNNKEKISSDVLLLGDSFVQGMCVEPDKNIGSILNKMSIKTSSIGAGGHGPLFSLATLKEYGEFYKHQQLIYLITPDNDYSDLQSEIKNIILLKYLENDTYTQNLLSKKELKSEVLNEYFDSRIRPVREFLRLYRLDLQDTRTFIKNLKNNNQNNPDQLNSEKLNNVFFQIIKIMKSNSIKNNNSFSVVFNLINPDIVFSNKKKDIQYRKKLMNRVLKTKEFLESNNIEFFDFNEYVFSNYNKDNISAISHFNNGRWDHYTEQGNKLLADKIYQNLIN